MADKDIKEIIRLYREELGDDMTFTIVENALSILEEQLIDLQDTADQMTKLMEQEGYQFVTDDEDTERTPAKYEANGDIIVSDCTGCVCLKCEKDECNEDCRFESGRCVSCGVEDQGELH